MSDQNQSPAPAAKSTRKRWVVPVAASVTVATVLAGVAFVVVDQQRREAAAEEAAAERAAEAAEEREERREEREREAAALAAKQEVYDECQTHLSGLLEALDEVNARLNVGLSQAEFSRLVGDASVAYNKIDVEALGALGGKCLTGGQHLEDALNAYSRVASRWNDCIYDYACDIDSIDPMMQSNWAAAGRKIDSAEGLMESLDPAASGQGGSRSRDT